MAELTQGQLDQIKRISDNLEASYNVLRRLSQNIYGLLAFGRATCDEVKAYNLYALSMYDTQRGMLESLRNAGQPNVPSAPAFPTLFTWKGVKGADAWKLDCKATGMSGLGLWDAPLPFGGTMLNGLLKQAVESTKVADPLFLSPNDIKVVTQDDGFFTPSREIPTLAQLTNQGSGLGAIPIVLAIVIATATVLVAVGVAYVLSDYFKEKSIQEETSKRTVIQLQAYSDYTQKRLDCYNKCVADGGSIQLCQDTCTKIITKPDIKIDPAREKKGLGFLGTVGLVVSASAAGIVLWTMYKKRQSYGGHSLAPGDDY